MKAKALLGIACSNNRQAFWRGIFFLYLLKYKLYTSFLYKNFSVKLHNLQQSRQKSIQFTKTENESTTKTTSLETQKERSCCVMTTSLRLIEYSRKVWKCSIILLKRTDSRLVVRTFVVFYRIYHFIFNFIIIIYKLLL